MSGEGCIIKTLLKIEIYRLKNIKCNLRPCLLELFLNYNNKNILL